MFSYRYMRMNMDGMRDGTEAVQVAAVVSPEGYDFRVSPLNMPMDMHMLGVMTALSDRLTLMGMVNVVDISMDHQTRMGGNFSTNSSGLGDIAVSALIRIWDQQNQRIHLNAGLSIPTGSIDAMGVTPASAPNETLLPYPMQVGSGTFEVLPGLTYLGQANSLSWGAQARGRIRLGENDRSYRWGQQVQLTGWLAYRLASWISLSGRLNGSWAGDISGADPAYNNAVMMRMVPTVFGANFGGTQVFAGLGTNVYLPSGALKNLRLGAEVELPLFRNLNGPQLETDFALTIGVQYSF